MRLSAKTFSAMLIVLALAAFQFDSYAQSRGNSRSTSTSRSSSSSSSTSGSVSRSSSSEVRKPAESKSSSVSKPSSASRGSSSATKPSASTKPSSPTVSKPADKPSGNVSSGRPSGQPSGNVGSDRPSGNNGGSVSRPDNVNRPKPDISPADRKPASDKPSVNKPSGNQPSVQRPSGNKPSMDRPSPDKPVTRPEYRPQPGTPKPDFKPGNHNKPISVQRPSPRPRPARIHPRDRDFMDYSKPSYHWAKTPHYYGYRVKSLPVNAVRHVLGGLTYYIYDNVWYRPYNDYYMVCRPPIGTSLAANLISDLAWTAVKISYYNTIANAYDKISENNAYIAQQNAVIAQNNATIAAQNQAIASSQEKAQAAYGIANQLGLVQSYAAADASYYYQDGVFYSQGADGQYYVIVPPAGAMVDRLPEDFDVVMLDGNKYYRVDDTVYQMVISEGNPYFEVLGQMN